MCFQVILAYESIVLCKCSGKYIDIYFILKITFFFFFFFFLNNSVIIFTSIHMNFASFKKIIKIYQDILTDVNY